MFRLSPSLVIPWLLLTAGLLNRPAEQGPAVATDLDTKVRNFLELRRGAWHDLNVPASDGQELHKIVLDHKYKSALEIGTSTGHSGIWIAWALSKTGGRLITIEIDKGRHAAALANFRESGVANYIDARLGDAHVLVPALTERFDFVFCDADKDWYKNYLISVLPKLNVGGCFAAHNVSERWYGYNREFLGYVRSLPYMDTMLFESGAGLSVSYKKAEK